jgi:hypothetical protein
MFTGLCKQKSIILPLFDPEAVKNILLQKSPFTSSNSATNHKVLIRIFEISLPLSFTPLTAIHSDRYTLNVTPNIDMFGNLLLRKFEQRNLSLSIFIAVNNKLTTGRLNSGSFVIKFGA